MSNYFSEEEKTMNASSNQEKPLSDKNIFEKFSLYRSIIKDKIIIYAFERWLVTAILLVLYLIRVILTRGYACLTYCIGIHILNSFIGFISPLEDPEDYDLNSDDSFLPQKNNEEFKPFQRKVKEYTFWSRVSWTFAISILLTFFKAFDIPVFWPLLLVYFFLIFGLVMKRQIQHMIKYHYLPWDYAKAKYGK